MYSKTHSHINNKLMEVQNLFKILNQLLIILMNDYSSKKIKHHLKKNKIYLRIINLKFYNK